MKALDTNVLARVFVDDPEDAEAARQRPAAVKAMSGPVFVPTTVLLEFEWVLRGFYDLPRADITRVLRALLGLKNVSLDDRDSVVEAVDAYETGLDLADALHLVQSRHCAAFVTLDKAFARRASKLKVHAPVELVGSGRAG